MVTNVSEGLAAFLFALEMICFWCKESGHFESSMFKMVLFLTASPWHITEALPQPIYLDPEDGGSMNLRNIAIHLQDYKLAKYRRRRSDY